MPAESAVRDGIGSGVELIETLRWEPGEGFVRLDGHLGRLYASAAALGFKADPEMIGQVLRQAVGDRAALRVRLTLAADGTTKTVTQPFESTPPDTVWTVRIASARLDADDLLLRHKTTRRHVYDAARSEFPREQADEVLLLNQRGEVCEGTITNLFVDIGEPVLLTPPVSCGLLPGVLRAQLVEQVTAREAIIAPDDLKSARRLFVGNSLRGLIAARLA